MPDMTKPATTKDEYMVQLDHLAAMAMAQFPGTTLQDCHDAMFCKRNSGELYDFIQSNAPPLPIKPPCPVTVATELLDDVIPTAEQFWDEFIVPWQAAQGHFVLPWSVQGTEATAEKENPADYWKRRALQAEAELAKRGTP